MKGIILDSGFGEWIQCPFSSNIHDEHIYIHWDCYGDKSHEEWYNYIFSNRWGWKLDFLEFIYYAFLHEELHILFWKMREERDLLNGAVSILHSKLMSAVLMGSVTGKTYYYNQKQIGEFMNELLWKY